MRHVTSHTKCRIVYNWLNSLINPHMEFWTIVYLLLCASAAEPSSSVCHHFVPQCQQLSHAVMLTIIIIKRTNTHTRSEWMDLIWLLTKWQCEHLVLKIKAGFLKNKSEQREPSVHYINTETLWTVQLLCLVVSSVLHPVTHYPRVFHRYSGCNVKLNIVHLALCGFGL